MARRRIQTEIRREQIAEAALTVVQRHGLSGLSMERVARHIGLVPSALYRHFPNKDAIIDAMLEQIDVKLQGLLDGVAADSESPLFQLREVLHRHMHLAQHFQALPRVLFSDEVWIGSPARKARLNEILTGYLGRIAGLLRAAKAKGQLDASVSPETGAVVFLGLFQPAALLLFTSDGGFDAHRHIDEAWQLFLAGIGAGANGRM